MSKDDTLLNKLIKYIAGWTNIRKFSTDATLAKDLSLTRYELTRFKRICVALGLAQRKNHTKNQTGGLWWVRGEVLNLRAGGAK